MTSPSSQRTEAARTTSTASTASTTSTGNTASTTSTLQAPRYLQSELQAQTAEWSPVTYMHKGMFQGRWMSFLLVVAQDPAVGRRKTDKDRRALAPSPILRMWIREHGSGGSPGPGVLLDPADVDISEIVCSAELAPPRAESSRSRDAPPSINDPESPRPGSQRRTPSPGGRRGSLRGSSSPPYRRDREPSSSRYEAQTHDSSGEEDELATPTYASRPDSRDSNSSRGDRTPRPTRSETADEISLPQHPGPPSARNLYGSLHVAGIRVIAMEGGLGLWFLFTDLSIRHEGHYSLRFRCYDLAGISTDSGRSAYYECRTADFQVFAPRNFPGLPKPTELAEHFARQGYKLNTRKNERQAASPPGSPRPASAAAGRPTSAGDNATTAGGQ